MPNCCVVGENVYFKKNLLVSNVVYMATDRLERVLGIRKGNRSQYWPYGEERTTQPEVT